MKACSKKIILVDSSIRSADCQFSAERRIFIECRSLFGPNLDANGSVSMIFLRSLLPLGPMFTSVNITVTLWCVHVCVQQEERKE